MLINKLQTCSMLQRLSFEVLVESIDSLGNLLTEHLPLNATFLVQSAIRMVMSNCFEHCFFHLTAIVTIELSW